MTAHHPITGYLTPEDVERAKGMALDRAESIANTRGKLQTIAVQVSNLTGVAVTDILGPARHPKLAQVRRLVWGIAHRHGMSQSAIARAVGRSASHLSTEARRETPEAGRANIHYRGIAIGSVERAVLSAPATVQDALERRCARSGETMADALVSFWAETHK